MFMCSHAEYFCVRVAYEWLFVAGVYVRYFTIQNISTELLSVLSIVYPSIVSR